MGLLSGLFGSSPKPDKNLGRAALEAAQLSRETLEWFKQEYENTRPAREAMEARAMEVSDAQLQGMELSNASARRADQRMQSIFEPLQDRIATDAENYDTAERRADAAASARADVDAGFSATQSAMQRALGRSGIRPGSARSMTMMQDVAGEQAKARAGASTGAVRNVEQQGYARRMDAAGMGQGVFGGQATMQQVATQSGNSSVGNAGAGMNAAMSGADLMKSGFNTAMQGKQIAGNLYGQQAQIQAAAGDNSGMWGALGGVAGSFLGSNAGSSWLAKMLPVSDKNKKKNTGDVTDGKQELEEIKATPVHRNWMYDPAKGGPDDGGKPRTGPMAQKVRATMGEVAAPGGKVIDLVTINGKMMAGMQALARRLEKVEEGLAA